jgi:hypothetical protein
MGAGAVPECVDPAENGVQLARTTAVCREHSRHLARNAASARRSGWNAGCLGEIALRCGASRGRGACHARADSDR